LDFWGGHCNRNVRQNEPRFTDDGPCSGQHFATLHRG